MKPRPAIRLVQLLGLALAIAAPAGAAPIRFLAPQAFSAGPALVGTMERPIPGDFDADGNVDLAFRSSSGQLMWMRNHGDGTLEAAIDLGPSAAISFGCAADLDLNGRDDLVTMDQADAAGAVTIRLGVAGLGPGATTIFPDSAGMTAAVAADLDGDGYRDLAFTNYRTRRVTVLWNDGSGGFSPAARTTIAIGTSTGRLALGDPDGDLDLDLYVWREPYYSIGPDTLWVIRNLGSRAFGTPVSSGLSGVYGVQDMDADGIPDAIRAGGVCRGRSDLGFDAEPIGSMTGDFNNQEPWALGFDSGDAGGLDLLQQVTMGSFTTCALLKQGEPLHFDLTESYTMTVNSLVPCDLEGDGTDELVLAAGANLQVFHARLGRLDARRIIQSTTPFDTPEGIAAGDITGDGKAEVRIACKYAGSPQWTNRGDGTFGLPSFWSGTYTRSVAFADLDADGFLDRVSEYYDPGFKGSLGVGFGGPGGGNWGTTYWQLGYGCVLGDFDGDGDTDILTFEDSLAVNQGGHLFSMRAATLPLGRAVDVTGDRAADIVTIRSDSVLVVVNDGAGNEVDRTAFSTGDTVQVSTIVDADMDGREDLVGITKSGRVWLTRIGPPGPTPPELSPTQLVAGTVYSIQAGRFDADNIPDLVVGTASGVTALRGLGDGTFVEPTFTAAVSPGQTHADVDGNGCDDLISYGADRTRTNVYIVLNATQPIPTPVLVSNLAADAFLDRVALAWWIGGDRLASVTLERAAGAAQWEAIATLAPDGSGLVRYEDRDVTPGARYGYRLRVRDGAAERTLGEVWVTVPERLAFGITRVWPNPARGDRVRVRLALPAREAATLELLDIAGRVVARRAIAACEPGERDLELAPRERLAPGLYFVRARQLGASATRRLVVTR